MSLVTTYVYECDGCGERRSWDRSDLPPGWTSTHVTLHGAQGEFRQAGDACSYDCILAATAKITAKVLSEQRLNR